MSEENTQGFTEEQAPASAADLMRELFQVRNQIDEVKQLHLKSLETRKKELELEVIAALDAQGVDRSAIRGLGTVAIQEAVVPQAEDWGLIHQYVYENQAGYLLNRAINAAAYREMLEQGVELPGAKPFTRRTLSVRKAA